jgi:hypothetical protein
VTTLRDLKVGDRVQVFESWGRGVPEGGYDGTVTKVGRKLITVDHPGGRGQVFRLETGTSNDEYGHAHIRTVEQAAEDLRERKALNELAEFGLRFQYNQDTPDVETVERLVKVLKGEL